MRQLVRYCIGVNPMNCTNRSCSAERDRPTLGHLLHRPGCVRVLVHEGEHAPHMVGAARRASRAARRAGAPGSGAAGRRTSSRSCARAPPRRRGACARIPPRPARKCAIQSSASPAVGSRRVDHPRESGDQRIERTEVAAEKATHGGWLDLACGSAGTAAVPCCMPSCSMKGSCGGRPCRRKSTSGCTQARHARQHVRVAVRKGDHVALVQLHRRLADHPGPARSADDDVVLHHVLGVRHDRRRHPASAALR